MNKSAVVILLVVGIILASVEGKKIGPSKRPARCMKATPRKEFCKRIDEVWYWNGKNDCRKLPKGCYTYDHHDNAFPTKMDCMKTCFYD